ncbi:lysoplasmalogenase family protein [Lacinutrix chionoecetis]
MISKFYNVFFNIKKPYFAIGYFSVLLFDIFVKINLDPFPLRYITKALLIVMLLMFYIKNRIVVNKRNHAYVVLALTFYLVADLTVINQLNTTLFFVSMFVFIMAKAMYCMRFTNNKDFNLMRLIPFLIGSFICMVIVFKLMYKNLGIYFVPVLSYFFVCLLLFLFAYLRKNDVNSRSYNYVIIAMFFFLFAEILMGLKTYYKPIPYESILVMLGYGIAQFLTVYGIIIEVKTVEND